MHWALIPILLVAGAAPAPMTLTVDGASREALVHLPEKTGDAGAPLVFVFHGHGGNMTQVARRIRIHELWPEAVVIYPQGLATPSKYDPKGLKPGWQKTAGDQHDRDLKFFDALLSTVKDKQKIDESRIYATGHSNGGGFTYLLWASRPELFAAVAPSAAGAGDNLKSLHPLPALHIAGEQDTVVPFANQQRTMEAIRGINHCTRDPRDYGVKGSLFYPSETHTPVVTLIHPGGHQFIDAALPLIVRFFKEHAKVAAADAAN